MKAKRYLTLEMARTIQPGTVLELGYNDFNHGRFTFIPTAPVSEGDGVITSRWEGIGRDGEAEWKMELYTYPGPHRDGSREAVMCRGSGAERVYLRKAPKAPKAPPSPDLLRGIREWCEQPKNYNAGWDLVAECYTDEELAEAIGGCTKVEGAIRKLKERVMINEERRREALAEVF